MTHLLPGVGTTVSLIFQVLATTASIAIQIPCIVGAAGVGALLTPIAVRDTTVSHNPIEETRVNKSTSTRGQKHDSALGSFGLLRQM